MNSMIERVSRIRSLATRIGLVVAITAGLVAFVPGQAKAVVPTLDLRVLVVSANGNEPAIAAWTAQLRAEGVPFDLLIAANEGPITSQRLVKGTDHARYQAIVMASPDLVACDSDGCASMVTADELAVLAEFERVYGVRQIDAYTYPTPAVGLSLPTSSGNLHGNVASLSTAGKAAFPYLVGSVPIEHSYGYLANPSPGVGETFETLVAAPTGEPLVGVYQRVDGRQEMVVTVDTNPWVLHSRLLLHGMLRWVTKGAYLGILRNYLSVHVDDVFLPDDRWDVNANTTHEDDGATIPLIRMTADDAQRLRTWQKTNSLKLDMAFNGGGSDEYVAENGSDPLTSIMLSNRSEFRWLNHTFSHPNLDQSTQSVIVNEIQANRNWARSKNIPIIAGELVTGEHSGLTNPVMPAALNKAGIKFVGSDNSRTPGQTQIGPALTVPRHPTNIYYNTATRQEQLDEYNYIYFENCTNTSTTTCLSAPATWSQYVERESTIMLGHMLSNDVRPHYVHQGNIAEDGILYDVLDDVIGRYRGYLSTPLVQPTLSDAGKSLARQSAWANALATNKVKASITGTIVTITPTVDLDVPLTASAKAKERYNNSWTYGTSWRNYGEVYGGLRSGWTSLRANKSLVVNIAP
ncbi:MAG: hypothetical protein ACSLFB_06545 [Acidimicrobiales bacterium]